MISHILFDIDGVVLCKRKRLFSKVLAEEFGASEHEDMLPFFTGPFQKCIVGKADLKQELVPYLPKWRYPHGVDALIVNWFEHERTLEDRILREVAILRAKGIRCFLATDNEKYRTEYLWTNLDLKSQFYGIFSSSILGVRKSTPEFWAKAFEQVQAIDRRSVLVWDDEEENVTAAKAFGLSAEFYTDFTNYLQKTANYMN
ncbi:MAG: HAD family hydrolase [bacterium]|nr:HAD family hydrolase [bacterium]